LEHPRAQVGSDDSDLGAPGQQPALQLAGAAGHVQEPLAPAAAHGVQHRAEGRVLVGPPAPVVDGGQAVVTLLGEMLLVHALSVATGAIGHESFLFLLASRDRPGILCPPMLSIGGKVALSHARWTWAP